MKRIATTLLAVLTLLSLTACSGNEQTSGSTPPPSSSEPAASTPVSSSQPEEVSDSPISSGEADAPENDGDSELAPSVNKPAASTGSGVLVAYFSVPETDGVDTVAGASRVATDAGVLGNTQFIAQAIQQAVGGDLFAIQTVQQYPGTHAELLDFAHNELENNARPELAASIEDLERYDVIFVGYPNWNADLPMPMYTFLETNDFSGKTIVPFSTHGGSGFSDTIETIVRLQPNATVITDGYTVSRTSVPSSAEAAATWAKGLGLAK